MIKNLPRKKSPRKYTDILLWCSILFTAPVLKTKSRTFIGLVCFCLLMFLVFNHFYMNDSLNAIASQHSEISDYIFRCRMVGPLHGWLAPWHSGSALLSVPLAKPTQYSSSIYAFFWRAVVFNLLWKSCLYTWISNGSNSVCVLSVYSWSFLWSLCSIACLQSPLWKSPYSAVNTSFSPLCLI